MNPNDMLAGLNIAIAGGWIAWGILLLYSFYYDRPPERLKQVFLVIFGVICFNEALDYGTTGSLRIVDNIAFPHVPHTLLPDFTEFPLGITLLILWRILLVVLLWALLFYVVVKKGETR